MRSFRSPVLAAVACATIVLGACASTPAADRPPTPTVPAVPAAPVGGAPTDGPEATPASASSEPLPSDSDAPSTSTTETNTFAPHLPPSPLDRYRLSDFDEQAYLDENALDNETKTAECMRDKGWDYVPFVADLPEFPPRSDLPDDSIAFFERYGYGVALSATPMAMFDSIDDYAEETASTDPNAQYASTLTPDERSRYELDLHGASNGASFEGGCAGPPDVLADAPGRDEEFRFLQFVASLRATAEADAATVAARARWLDCMGRDVGPLEVAGAQVRVPQDMYNYVDALLRVEAGQDVFSLDSAAPGTLGPVIGMIGGVDLATDGAWVQPTPEALDAFQARELQLAQADWACQGEARVIETRDQVENDLVPALLEAFPTATRLDD